MRKIKSQSDQQTARRQQPWLMASVSCGAVALSIGIAGVGVSQLVGWDGPLLAAGSAGLILAVALSEIAAARLPVHAEARIRGDGSWIKGLVAAVCFAALTGVNLLTGHMGLKAIDMAGVDAQRAPLQRALTQAEADFTSAAAAEAAVRAAAMQAEASYRQAQQAGLRQLENGYFGANGRLMAQAEAAAAQRTAAIAAKAAISAQAEAQLKAAKAALAHAPQGRPERELFGLALVLELLKGALVWCATANGSRRKPSDVVRLKPFGEMSADELDAIARHGMSLAASARHERSRRLRAAA